MKVTGLKTMVVEAEKPYIGGKYFLFLELETDEGITGIGERIAGSSYSDHLKDIKSQISLIEEFVGQFVLGKNPLNIELIWDTMYGSRHDLRHPSLYATPVISAIDMALWDIAGKAANQPIYNLLGGQYHEKLRAYAYMPSAGLNEHPEKAGDVAAQLLEEGNTACKIDPFMPLHPIRDIPLWEIENADGGHEFCGEELTAVEAPGYEHVLTDTLVNDGGDTLLPGTYSEALNGYEVHCEEHAH